MNPAYCFIGVLASAEPPFLLTEDSGPLMLLSRWVYEYPPVPVLKVRNRWGSLMKFTPALKSCPRPIPAVCQEKSSRNCHFFCCVACGVLRFWPIVTLFGKDCAASRLFAVMALAKSAYWKMNSFSFAPPSTQL